MLGELKFTYEWLEYHVSDHSAVNHRLQVILHIIHMMHDHSEWALELEPPKNESYLSFFDKSSTILLLEKALDDSSSLIIARPGYESLWSHRRSLLQLSLPILRMSVSTRTPETLSITDLYHSCLSSMNKVAEVVGGVEVLSSPNNKIGSAFDGGDMAHLLDVLHLIQFEAEFVLSCVSDRSSWNHDNQVVHGVRYLLFLLYQVIVFLVRFQS